MQMPSRFCLGNANIPYRRQDDYIITGVLAHIASQPLGHCLRCGLIIYLKYMPQIEGLYATVKPLKYSIILLSHFAWATASQNLKYSKVVTQYYCFHDQHDSCHCQFHDQHDSCHCQFRHFQTVNSQNIFVVYRHTPICPFGVLNCSSFAIVTIIAITLSY